MSDAMTYEIPDELPDTCVTRAPIKQLREGWMPLEVTRVEKKTAGTGTFMIIMSTSPVNEDGKVVTSLRSQYRLCLPFANPVAQGHKAPNTFGLCRSAVRALAENYPEVPQKTDGGYALSDGRVLDRTEASTLFDAADVVATDTLKAWWRDPSGLVGKRFYGKIKHEQKGDRVYADVDSARREAPADAEVITDNFTA